MNRTSGTAMAGGAMTDTGTGRQTENPGFHEMEGRTGNHVTLPYATPQIITRLGQVPKRPQTGGVSAIVPYNYTIVDTKTLGSSGRLRSGSAGPTQEF